ncbi:MAG: hypothetical protein MGG11_03325 [Trichodesmium sp. MAG_R03]|nr:hypothetical protein [Trichodesmium sp. MAG_R03]
MSILKLYSFDPQELIESWANDFLRRVHKTANFSPKWPFDASLVANFLDLGVVWDDIPPDEREAIAVRILLGGVFV